jgi:hypothetical protein
VVAVDPDDDTIRRYVVLHSRYDPVRQERRQPAALRRVARSPPGSASPVTGSGVRRIARSRSHLGLGATTTPAVQEGTLTDGLYGLANRWAGILHGCLRHRERYSEEQA